MTDPVAAGAALIDRCHGELVAPLLPADQPVWDVHAHLGEDDDGSVLDVELLTGEARRFGVDRTFVFPFRHADVAAYREQNDAVIAAAASSDGMLIPFCRVEPGLGDVAELTRAIDAGARGIKLHPLTGRFEVGHPLVASALELAEARSLPVLLHAGRGIAMFAAQLEPMLERHPGAQVILAHAGIGDQEASIETAARHPNLVFDVAVWNLLDILALVARVAPEQILYGTDAPYYGHACSQAKLLLALRAAGAGERHVRAMLWDNAARIAEGRSPDAPSPPVGASVAGFDYRRLRAHEYLLACAPLVWTRQPDLLQALRLARHAVGDPGNRELEAACEMIDLAALCWAQELEQGSRREILSLSWTTFRLLEFADALILCS
jgi:predicted TIM-barrel fold metal-dependent hydrolase